MHLAPGRIADLVVDLLAGEAASVEDASDCRNVTVGTGPAGVVVPQAGGLRFSSCHGGNVT